MATEVLAIPTPPTLTNGYDGGANYNLGIRFSLVAPQDCVGVTWLRTPDAPIHTPAGGSWVATLWNWDTQAILANQTFTPGAAQSQDVLFSSAVPLVNGVNYAVTVFTQDYTFRANGGSVDTFTPSNNTVGDSGLIATSGGATGFPNDLQAAWYYVSPLMDVGGPAEGSAALGLDYAVSTTGGADAGGSASAGLALALAATGRADHSAVVALGLGLTVAASGSTAAQGAVSLGLGMAVAAAGSSGTPEGQVSLTLRLAVDARGSNGDSGRPVKPWPFPSEPVSSFPWTPRPVKSFQEVSTP